MYDYGEYELVPCASHFRTSLMVWQSKNEQQKGHLFEKSTKKIPIT